MVARLQVHNFPSRNLVSKICISGNHVTTLGSNYGTMFSKEKVTSMKSYIGNNYSAS